jgi:hypothetical protein
MATTTIHCGINFFTPKIETTIFLVTHTKPNQPFENTYMLDMAPPKILNYATMFKKLKNDLINSTLPLFNKKTKENKIDFLPNKEFSFGSLMFVTTKATMNLWHLIVHLKKINSSTIGITKKTQVFGNPWQNAAPMYFPLHFQLIFFIYLPKQTCDMNNFFGLS